MEAAVRSGALNTANWTTRLNRVLMAVPGPVTSAPSEGVHELIRSHNAELVTRSGDVLELVSPAGSFLTVSRRGEDQPRDRLTERERRVLDAVPVSQAVGGDSIAYTAGLSVSDVLSVLDRMRVKGFVEVSDDRWRLARG